MKPFQSFRDKELLREELQLRREIEQTRDAMDAARSRFEQAVDPLLIDCFIYELNAAQLKYQFLLRNFKKVRASAAGGHSQHSASRRERP